MHEPKRWGETEWRAYVEVCEPGDAEPSTRAQRLAGNPDFASTDPNEVTDWIEDMTRRHASRRAVHLIGGGIAETGDEGQRRGDFGENLDVLHRGDSLYLDFHHGTGRMHLWVEAINSGDREVREPRRGE